MSSLINDDLKPTTEAERTWRWYHFTALWIGMVMCIPAYTLAASLIEGGMSWSQAVGTVFLGNAIVLVPMLLIGHAGAKYGIPYAVLARASFGTIGARLPAVLRALVACGWYGIQTWFGGAMIHTLVGVVMGQPLGGDKLPVLGITASQLICFLAFWAIQFWYVIHGIESIRKLETYTAPIKIVICFVLLWWAWDKAGGFGPIIDQPSQFVEGGKKAGKFAEVFWPSLTAMVGFWATLALNIPDFTRFSRSQRDQVLGQTIGLPAPMGLLAMLAVFVTSATVVIYGKAIWDPVDLSTRMTGAAVLVALIVLLIDTISVNLAANLVGPAYDFSALNPRAISLQAGRHHHRRARDPDDAVEGAGNDAGLHLHLAHRLLGAAGPVAGHPDRRLLPHPEEGTEGRRPLQRIRRLHVQRGVELDRDRRPCLGVLPNVPGFLNAAFPQAFPDVGGFFKGVYTYAWFVGLAIAAVIYWLGMRGKAKS
jgi:NCS1 family nucleobase:cation symporter-1